MRETDTDMPYTRTAKLSVRELREYACLNEDDSVNEDDTMTGSL